MGEKNELLTDNASFEFCISAVMYQILLPHPVCACYVHAHTVRYKGLSWRQKKLNLSSSNENPD